MSDMNGAAAPAADAPLTMSQAVAAIAERRRKDGSTSAHQDSQAAPAGETPREDAPQRDSPPDGDAAPDDQATGETETIDPTPEESPLDRPRSWSKDRDAAWAKLDRETQQHLLDHDREASRTIRKAQNDAAEKLKGLTAKEQAVEQARGHYEAGLVSMQEILQAQVAGQFADIKTMADVQKMASEDWPRYIQWDAAQKQLAAVVQERQAAEQRQQTEYAAKLNAFNGEQDKLFLERAPELADKEKMAKVSDTAVKLLKDIGFSEDELARSYHQGEKFSIRDHRIQLLIRDAVNYRQAKANVAKPASKPVPQVQQPGVARPAGAAQTEQVAALDKKLDRTGSLRDAVRLRQARREASQG